MNTELMFSSEKQDWTTPRDLFDRLNEKYNFTLDAAANKDNALLPNFFGEGSTIHEDGLSASWEGHRVFCNPPYGRVLAKKWVYKSFFEYMVHDTEVCLLLPARTDTKWFHEWVYGQNGIRVEFLRGRLKFGGCKNPAPFPSMLVFMGM